ncbi:hypothetical protein ABZY19_21210 [Streptomyces sp. NPDC006475]|uniref:hypothetical protein n=1 Tax=Streptomyces sp. NPDC006475 TaxID=3155719 RepID=UPI0033BC82A0
MGLLEEEYVQNASRWHRLTSDTIDTVRAALAPRARLAVWPDLASDTAAVLDALPTEGLIEAVWQDSDGQMHSAVADKDEFRGPAARIAGADGQRSCLCTPMIASLRSPLSCLATEWWGGSWLAERSINDLPQKLRRSYE